MVLERAISSHIREHPHLIIDIESRKLAATLKTQLPETEERQMRRQRTAESQAKKLKLNPNAGKFTEPVENEKIDLSVKDSLPNGEKTIERSSTMPVEIETFLRNYTAGAYDDKQKVIWTQQRSSEMEWLLLNPKPAELNDNDCQYRSASGIDAELDTKPVISNKMHPPMLYNDIKVTPTVNNERFIGMHAAVNATAYYTRSETLYQEYQSLYWGANPNAGLHMIQRYGLDRLFTFEEIQSLNYKRVFQIPTEKEALVYLRSFGHKTLPFDSEDPNVLENVINTRIRVESQKQDHPMQLRRKRQTLRALADTVMARPSTLPVELMQNAMAFMPGQSTMPVERHYELVKPVTRFNLFQIYHKRKTNKQGPEFWPDMIKEFGLPGLSV